jgi:hypothetical protein
VAAASQPVQIEDRQARRACASRMLPALLMTQHAAGRGVDLVFNAARLYLCALIAQITHDAKRGLYTWSRKQMLNRFFTWCVLEIFAPSFLKNTVRF